MALGDEKRDEQKDLPDSSGPNDQKRPGEFTRFFFGMELGKGQIGENPAQSYPVSGSSSLTEPVPKELNPLHASLNADAPPRDLNQEHSIVQHESRQADGGTLSDLFGQVPLKPINPQSDTFSRLFNNQFETQPGPVPPTDFPVTGGAGRAAPASTPRLSPEFPTTPQKDAKFEDGSGSVSFGNPPQSARGQKATKLFSSESTAADRLSMGSPSAFTRVIDASALRSAAEGADNNQAAVNNSPPATPASASPPAMPSWPVASAPSPPIYPPVYVPQPSVSMQMPMPAVNPVAWPPTPSFPAVSSSSLPQPQMQSLQPTTEQRWIAYLPLIIGLNILLFLTSIFILIFALSR